MVEYRVFEAKVTDDGIATMLFMGDVNADDPSNALAKFIGTSIHATDSAKGQTSEFGSDPYPSDGDYVVIPLSHIHSFSG